MMRTLLLIALVISSLSAAPAAQAVAVQAEEVVFTPQHTLVTRTDPTLAEPTWTTSPDRPPRSMTWSVSGRTLTLVENGSPTSYQRE